MECLEIDLNNVCRTCKNESREMKSLCYRYSESDKKNPRLDEMLMACASVQVNNDDGLPKSICLSCFVQLKNAYSFKEQCEETDLFLRDYLKNSKKDIIKVEVMTDVEFTSNFIARISDDHGSENKNDGAASHSDEACGKDFDYDQVVDSNFTIYQCRTCSKVFYTLEGLRSHKRIHTDNNIVDYIKMDIDDNTITCSDQSDVGGGGGGDDLVVNEENVKPEVKTSENNDQEKSGETVRLANEIYVEEDPLDMLEETKIEVEVNRVADEPEVDNGNGYQSDASTHSEYLPTKQTPTKIKRGRGRPRKHPVSLKPTGRSRGRPSLLKLNAKSSKKEIGNFPCPQCKEVFTKMRLLEKHAEQHDGLQIHECDTCNKKFRKRNTLKQHKLSHVDGKPFSCKVCGKCFKFKNNLQRHTKLHLSADVHSCDLCQAVFNLPHYLAEHKTLIHKTDEKKYKCQFCQRGFTAENYRDLHMKVHYGDGKFHCRTCEKTFTSKSHLTKHMSFHNNNSKKFLCSECGQRFIRHDYLVIHMRRHRGEKPFKCKFCERAFTRSTDLTVHERYHTGETTHLCVICGRGFGRAYNLTVHMRTHTGEKPYRCTYCDAAFAQGYDLKAHVRRHTGERFQCELCPKTFLMIYLLTQHKRVEHGLNIDSNIKRLRRINKLDPDDTQPVTESDPLQTELSEVKEEVSEVKQEILELKQEQKSDMM